MESIINPLIKRAYRILSLPNVVRLPEIIHTKHFTYELLLRGAKCMLYEQRVNPKKSNYEVFAIKQEKAKILPSGKYLPNREKYPSANNFGYWAWTYTTLERAILKFNELEETTTEQ